MMGGAGPGSVPKGTVAGGLEKLWGQNGQNLHLAQWWRNETYMREK